MRSPPLQPRCLTNPPPISDNADGCSLPTSVAKGKKPDSKTLIVPPCPAFAAKLTTPLPKIPAAGIPYLLRFGAGGVFGSDNTAGRDPPCHMVDLSDRHSPSPATRRPRRSRPCTPASCPGRPASRPRRGPSRLGRSHRPGVHQEKNCILSTDFHGRLNCQATLRISAEERLENAPLSAIRIRWPTALSYS